jgi:hypothetical protein
VTVSAPNEPVAESPRRCLPSALFRLPVSQAPVLVEYLHPQGAGRPREPFYKIERAFEVEGVGRPFGDDFCGSVEELHSEVHFAPVRASAARPLAQPRSRRKAGGNKRGSQRNTVKTNNLLRMPS